MSATKSYTWPKITSVDASLDLQATNKQLCDRFKEFFQVTEQDSKRGADNVEEHLYDQFLLDQPKSVWNKKCRFMYTRDELIGAMHGIYKKGDILFKRQRIVRRHGKSGRLCKRDFAVCLSALGGRFKMTQGRRYWVNVQMTRTPSFSWDV